MKQLRERLGESQTEFAKRFGVSLKTVWRWENEETPLKKSVEMALEEIKRTIS